MSEKNTEIYPEVRFFLRTTSEKFLQCSHICCVDDRKNNILKKKGRNKQTKNNQAPTSFQNRGVIIIFLFVGVFIVRGENVVLLGEFDESRECLADLQEVGVSEILEIQREDTRQRKETEDRRTRALRERGLLQYSLFESAQNEDF